ncbi:MAG: 50S ribosomal protein L17 [Fimbriimonadaceae bacterium]|mgnify:CR=1 FL=1|nr:50S ribosomal protein L17 [Fimbriimonadaceae bacterium]QYK58280.1 MAG: 50S ribosomal protein L17 [Fimbriimonadaceae bacterium]
MRHKNDHRKLGLPSDQRRALLTNLARQFVRVGYVHTTHGRAKELQRVVEKLITTAKNDSLHARREARKILVGHSRSSARPTKALAGKTDLEKLQILQERSLINGEDLVKHLFDHVAPLYAKRNGGYTRLTRTGTRRGDGADTAVLELVRD